MSTINPLGGSSSSNNPNVNRVRAPRMHLKVWLKIEQIARLRCAGITDQQIKNMLGISVYGFHRITRLKEYKDVEAGIYAGTITKFDEMIGSRAEAMKLYFASAVPASMRALVDMVLQKRDLKARLEAAKEILNRDPKKVFVNDSRRGADAGADEDRAALPARIMEHITNQGSTLASEVEKADLGPSGKPN